VLGHRPALLAPRRQRHAVEELHDDVRVPRLHVSEVEDLDDPRMLDRRGRLRLVEEPVDDLAVGRQLGVKDLDRDDPADQHVLGAIDRTHPADAHLIEHTVAADDRADQRRPPRLTLEASSAVSPLSIAQPAPVVTQRMPTSATTCNIGSQVALRVLRRVRVQRDPDRPGHER
jgi:hypothetical protein